MKFTKINIQLYLFVNAFGLIPNRIVSIFLYFILNEKLSYTYFIYTSDLFFVNQQGGN